MSARLTENERRQLGCSCWQVEGVWHHVDHCRVEDVEAIIAARQVDGVADETTVLQLVKEHRPNVVTEEIGDGDGGTTWRTRVKCDGNDCDFYVEAPRYWDAVNRHSEHLATTLRATKAEVEAAILRSVADRVDAKSFSGNGMLRTALLRTEAARIEAAQ